MSKETKIKYPTADQIKTKFEKMPKDLKIKVLYEAIDIMIGQNQLQKVEIDQEAKKLYIYYIQDNSHLMSNPPPPPSYYREVYSFDDLKLEGKEYAEVERAKELIKWKQ